MSKTLVVWEDVPEECSYYYILDDEEHADIINLAVQAAGSYDEGEDLPEDHAIFLLADELVDKFPDAPSVRPIEGTFSRVITCRFFL